MATVTAFTAARSQAIEDANIVSAAVDGNGDLILTRHDGGTINAGSVIGPQGDQGDPGPAGSVLPSGTLIHGNWPTVPSGYRLVNGDLIVNGAIDHPDLAAAWPSWVVGNDIQLPNFSDTYLVTKNNSPGASIGSNTKTLTTDNIPGHSHSLQSHTHSRGSFDVDIDHDHPQVNTTSAGEHQHDIPVAPNDGAFGQGAPRGSSSGTNYTQLTKSNGTHQHSVNIPNYNVANRVVNGISGPPSVSETGSSGAGQAFNVQPLSYGVKTAVKL